MPQVIFEIVVLINVAWKKFEYMNLVPKLCSIAVQKKSFVLCINAPGIKTFRKVCTFSVPSLSPAENRIQIQCHLGKKNFTVTWKHEHNIFYIGCYTNI